MTVSIGARVEVSTINEQLKELVKPGEVKSRLIGRLGQKGRIEYGVSGKKTDWRVVYRQQEPIPYDDMDSRQVSRVNRHRTAEVDWKAWTYGEGFSLTEKLINRGDNALFNLVEENTKLAATDFMKFLAKQPFTDGDVSGDNNMDGLETMFSDISSLVTDNSSGNGMVGDPSGQYAGLYMDLNYYGAGSFVEHSSREWPEGVGLKQFHFFSPLAVDVTNANWDVTTSEWKYTWRLAMNYATTFLMALHEGRVDDWVMTPSMLMECQNSLIDKERYLINGDANLVNLGFDHIDWNGTKLLSDVGCTDSRCYGLAYDEMQLRCLTDQLVLKETDDDVTTLTDAIYFLSMCNMKFTSPAYFPVLMDIT